MNIDIKKALNNIGIESLNEMQQYVSDVFDESNNIILLSPTGSGKTLAFLLPIISRIDKDSQAPQVLILTPSRELSLQTEDTCRKLQTGIRIGCCYGGHSAGYEEKMLENPPSIIVGTPGRIKDHAERGRLDLRQIQTLVLDEFDKCLEYGFSNEMDFIINQSSNISKKVLISATEMDKIPDFAKIDSPFKINFLSERETIEKLKIYVVPSPSKDKIETLLNLICYIGDAQSIIFCNYRAAAERVASYLKTNGIDCNIYHGGLEQQEREKALCTFRNGSCNTLVSTDLASRGLDIPDVKHIIHYHLPSNHDAYTHRNGRTARMFAEGASYILLSAEEELPEFIDKAEAETLSIAECKTIPPQSQWVTIYIGKGKRDKISNGDVAGFLMQKGKLAPTDLGIIEVKEHYAYAAVKKNKVKSMLNLVSNEKIKRMKTKIEIAK